MKYYDTLWRLFALPLVALAFSAPTLVAVTVDKANNADHLNLGSSWIAGQPPTSFDIGLWSATVTGPNTVAVGANTNWLGLKLTNPGGNVTLNGPATLTLANAGLDLSTATRDLTLNCPLGLAADQAWTVAAGRVLTMTGGAAGGTAVLSRTGAGTNVFNGGTVTLRTLNVTGGAVTRLNAGNLTAAGGSGAYGYAVVSGGGRFEQTGGTFTTPVYFTVGQSTSGGTPLAALSGGSFSAAGELLIGYAANGILNLSGTATANAGAKLRLGQAGNATLNLDGGTLIAREIGTGGTSGSVINLNGGQLRAGSPTAATWWPLLSGVSAFVKTGGAWVDDAGLNVAINQPLLDGTGGGGLRKTGHGTLTLGATNTFTGPTLISNGTLVVNGRLNGVGTVTAKPGATLRGTGSIAGMVMIENDAGLTAGPTALTTGPLWLTNTSALRLTLGTGNTGTNAPLRVNGSLILDGMLTVTDAGDLTPGTTLAAIHYTGTLMNHGLALNPRSEWHCGVDTAVPGLVRLQVMEKYPLIECTNGSFTVTSTSTNLGGVLHGYPTLPPWYEVRDASGRLWDAGSFPAVSPWAATVRHLRPGTNTVTFFAQNAAGVLESNTVQVTFALGDNPPVRPRPQPAEVWWGGTCHDNLYSGGNIVGTHSRLEQLTNTVGWDFVKRFQDGFLLHGYVWVNDIARMTNWQTVGPAISAQLTPFNTRYWLENGWRPRTNDMNYGTASVSAQVTDVNDMLGVGFALSEVTQDYNPMWYDFSRWQPAWPTNDIRVAGTGHTHDASPAYPYASGQWRDFLTGFHAARPNIQMGWTWSPVYFRWLNGIAIRDDGRFSITNGPTVYSFSWDFYDWMVDAIQVGQEVGAPFAFASDCPWGWYGAWGNPGVAVSNRAKIRAYESWLHNQGLRHTFICNDATSDSLLGNPSLWDATFKSNSLRNLYLHQQEGGRAARYLFESWYRGPFTLLPETQPGTYANLALEALKFIKGIADTNGTLEPLSLTVLSTGAVTTVRLQNNGAGPCLPALLAFESGDPAATVQYSNASGVNITAQLLSAEGYAHTNLLQPGQSTTITIGVQNLAAAQRRSVTLEAFWNPQDPGGFVRDRVTIPLPVSFTWTNNASGNWSTVANWTNNLAPAAGGAENATVRFSGGGYTASNNFAGQFVLNTLELNSATGTSLAGGALRFAVPAGGVAAPQLNQNAAGAVAVNNPLVLDAQVTLGGSGAGAMNLNGSISGAGGLTKSGSATVTLAGSNTFSGVTRITSGTLIVGDGTNNSALSALTTNSGTLRFVTAVDTTQTHDGTIHGTGVLQKQGDGTLILGGANTFSGTVQLGAQNVNGGGLRITQPQALGATSAGTVLGGGTSNARLELEGGIAVAEPLTLAQRAGSIVHVRNVAGVNSLSGPVTLAPGGNTWTLHSDAGKLFVTGNLTSTANDFIRPLHLQGDGDGELSGILSDSSLAWLQVRKYGQGTWTMSGPATVPQGLQVQEGAMILKSSVGRGNGPGGAAVYGGLLGGIGTLSGSVTVDAGGTLAPGVDGIGSITLAGNLTFNPGSVCVMEISRDTPDHDRVQGIQTVSYGGTLMVTNRGGSLVAGDSFQLFSAAHRTHTFNTLNLPPLAPGLMWSNRLQLDGSLAVVASHTERPRLQFSLTAPNYLVFNWTNDVRSFRLQSQTNGLHSGLSPHWFDYPGGTNPPVLAPFDPTCGSVFFRLIAP